MEATLVCDKLVGREKDVNAILRFVNKGVNVAIIYEHGAGASAVLDAVEERLANGKHPGRKLAFFPCYGNKRDLDALVFAVSCRHGDMFVPDFGEQQTYEKHRTGSVAVLERRSLSGITSSAEPYLIGLDGVQRIDRAMGFFMGNLLETKKVSFVVTVPKDSLKNSAVENFIKGFDRYELKGLNDAKVVELIDYLVERNGIEITPADEEEIRRKLPRIAYGKPAAVIEKLSRALREKKLDKNALLEDYPISTTKYVPYGHATGYLLLLVLAVRYYWRLTGEPADYVLGGGLMVFAMVLFRLLRAF